MTPAMRRCLDAIIELTVDGVPPSFRELGDALGLSISGVHRLVNELQEAGHISYRAGVPRSIEVLERDGLRHYSVEALNALQGRIARELWRRQQGWAA